MGTTTTPLPLDSLAAVGITTPGGMGQTINPLVNPMMPAFMSPLQQAQAATAQQAQTVATPPPAQSPPPTPPAASAPPPSAANQPSLSVAQPLGLSDWFSHPWAAAQDWLAEHGSDSKGAGVDTDAPPSLSDDKTPPPKSAGEGGSAPAAPPQSLNPGLYGPPAPPPQQPPQAAPAAPPAAPVALSMTAHAPLSPFTPQGQQAPPGTLPAPPVRTSDVAPMQSSTDPMAFVKAREGFSATPYKDTDGQWRNGYGTVATSPTETIDEGTANQRLQARLGQSLATVDKAAADAGITLTPTQRTALGSFDFNTGAGAKVIGESKGDVAAIPGLMSQYTNAGGNPNQGLVNRRAQEAAHFNAGAPPPTATTGLADAQQAPPQQGNPNADIAAQLRGILPSPEQTSQNRILALASGLLSGPTFGAGLGRGLAAVVGVNQEDIGNRMRAAELGAQLQMLGIRGNYMAGKLDQGNVKLGIDQQNADTRVTTAGNQTKALTARLDGSLDAAKANVKDNYADADEIQAEGEEAKRQLPVWTNLQQTLNTSGAGPSVQDQWKRQIALTFGIPIGNTVPTSTQLQDALSKMTQADAARGMKGTGLRTQREFETFTHTVGSIGTDPNAMRTIAGMVVPRLQSQSDAYDQWFSMPAEQRAAVLQGPAQSVATWRAQHSVIPTGERMGVQEGAPTKPTIALKPDQNGKPQWQNVDPRTGLGFTVH
jgi:GH24 family phage-related lysozyme (muramidase)